MKYYLTAILKAWDFSQWKVLVSAIIGAIVTLLSTFSQDYLGISAVMLASMAFIILADFITGIAASRYQKTKLTSKRGLKSLYKTGAYLLFLFVAFSLTKEVPESIFRNIIKYFHIYLIVHITFWELFSIDENLKKMGVNLGLTSFLHAVLKRFQSLVLKGDRPPHDHHDEYPEEQEHDENGL